MALTEQVEHKRRRFRRREKPRGPACLNCGTEIDSPFCPHCGQENVPADLTLPGVLREFLTEIAYYDSKMWRTVRTLIAHPGRLSSEWSAGRRASYLSPVRLYLTVSFLFFVLTAWRGPGGVHVQTGLSPKDRQDLISKVAASEMTPLERDDALAAENSLGFSPDERARYEEALDKAVDATTAKAAQAGKTIDDEDGLAKLGWFGHQVRKLQAAAKDNPKELTARYLDQVPKALFVVLPLCALVLRLLYALRRHTYVEHLVFLLHFHSFMFLAYLPAVLVPYDWIGLYGFVVTLFWIPGYVFVAMLRFYKQHWLLTLVKSWILGFAYMLLAAGGALLALLLLTESLPEPKPTPSKPAAAPAHSAPAASVRPAEGKVTGS